MEGRESCCFTLLAAENRWNETGTKVRLHSPEKTGLVFSQDNQQLLYRQVTLMFVAGLRMAEQASEATVASLDYFESDGRNVLGLPRILQ
jgi:hypothetical protein